MKVFVTGATGAIGSHVVPALIEAGHEVSALARSQEKAGSLALLGARPVAVSLFDRAGLTAAFAGHNAVINLATSIPSTMAYAFHRSWRGNDRIRTEGSAAVVDAAIAAGVPNLVQESVAFVYQDSGDAVVDEQTPLDLFPVVASASVAEGRTARFTESGGSGVVLRFGLFYGPGSAQSSEMLALARWHVGIQLGRAKGHFSSIHLADAASAVVAALDAPSGIYNIVDDEPVTKRAWGDAVSAAVGRRPWLHTPGRLTTFGRKTAEALNRSLRISNRHFREATGWVPMFPSVREGWRDTADKAAAKPAASSNAAARIVAALIALIGLYTGVWAQFFPSGFYTSFPGLGHHWVDTLPPYNEHLVRDVGGLYLALAAVAIVAAIRPSRLTQVAAGLAAVVESVPHLVFHLAHTGDLSAVDAVEQAAGLGAQLVLGLALLGLATRRRPQPTT